MTEGQRPRQTARSLWNSLTNELVEQRQSLEEIACLSANDSFHLRSGHIGRRDQRQIDLRARSRWNRPIGFDSARNLLDRLEVDLQSECWLGPNGCIESKAPRRTHLSAIHRNVPKGFAPRRAW